MKKKIAFAAIILIVIFALANRLSKKQPAEAEPAAKAPQNVSVQKVADSASLIQKIEYPAIIAGDQEIKVTAKSAGTATAVNFDLGKSVGAGSLLVKIDSVGNNSGIGDNGFRSSDVQQSGLSVQQAQEAVDLAKKNRKALQQAYDAQKKNPAAPQTINKAQIQAAGEQVDIAQIQLDNAKVGLQGTLDNHLITSPIQGFVTKKSVSVGDSVSVGQELATISKTALTKVQFFVSKEELANFKVGGGLTITSDGSDFPAAVARIAPEADPATKRFLIEAKVSGNKTLLIGSVLSVSFDITHLPSAAGNIILPLSAVTIGQNENFIFIVADGKAKKISVSIANVQGEFAEVKADLPADAEIITSGSKLVSDGDSVTVQ